MRRIGTALLGVLMGATLFAMPALGQDQTERENRRGVQQERRRSGGGPTAEQMESARRRMGKNAPLVADLAPVFKLKSLDGKSETDVASFRGKRPVLLFFGSYT